MPSEVILPRVDMDMATGKISKWLVEPGAAVSKGQPLFEIETDKATMEIEAEAEGTIRDLVDAGSSDIPVGSVVAWIDREGETPPPAGTAPPARPAAAGAMPEADRRQPEPATSAVPSSPPDASGSRGSSADASGRPRATPLARRLAREHAIDLSSLTGSGPRGRIQAADFERHVAADVAKPPSRLAPPAARLEADTRVPGRPPAGAAAAGKLNLVRLREGDGAPVVLIHGFGADANGWRPVLPSLGVPFPLFGVDLPGHGQSALPGDATFAALADAVEETLLGADLRGATLLGHSLGGAVAAAVAARGTLDVRRLVLLSPAGLGPDINGGFVRGFLAAEREASLTPWMHELVTDPAAITPAFVRATLKTRAGTGLAETQRRVAEAVFPDGTQAFSIRADLARIALPVRVVVGTADRIIPARHADTLPPLVALHRLPGIGHMPHYEARDVVGAILRHDLVG